MASTTTETTASVHPLDPLSAAEIARTPEVHVRHPFNPNSDVAASKTLPLGTTAKVTNVQNGRSAMVKVEDRGPHVAARVVDVTPKVADQLDMKKAGVAPVVVAPVAVPQADGTVKLGAGAAEIGPDQLQAATREARAISR